MIKIKYETYDMCSHGHGCCAHTEQTAEITDHKGEVHIIKGRLSKHDLVRKAKFLSAEKVIEEKFFINGKEIEEKCFWRY